MPGDERKFKRLTIVACIPGCNRERDVASSQGPLAEGAVSAGEGIAEAVGVDSITGVLVEVAGRVAVGVAGFPAVAGGEGVTVRAPGSVCVGEGTEVVRSGSMVPLGA